MNETKILDMGEAAALQICGYSVVRLDDSNNGSFKIFVFNQSSTEIEDILSKYRINKLNVDAYRYWIAIRGLKKRIADMNLMRKER